MLEISENKLKMEQEQEQFYALRTLKTPGLGRLLAKVLIVIVAITFLILFLPWQQNIRGTGTVTTLRPENRPQTIESAIAGRIIDWRVREGQFVKKGDTILLLAEIKEKYFDPLLLSRLTQQIVAKEASVEAKKAKNEALESQIRALNQSRVIKLNQAKNKIDQAKLKLESDSIGFVAEKVAFDNQANLYVRNKQLYEARNIPLTKFQEIESKYEQARAKVITAENKWWQSKAELEVIQADVAGIQADYLDKISKAQSDLSSTLSDLYDTEGSLVKMQNEYANMEVRNQQYTVIAPQSGFVVKTLQSGIGETIKEGEAVATILPDTEDQAAEMFIKAMDLPFIREGRKVRIQFDGWPVLQFSGWPNVSVGTFGGVVQVIDRVESQPGMFRILISPDPTDEEWPHQIRMGSGIKGWVMLNDVPIWFELWRQLNGFPPTIYQTSTQTAPKK